MTELDVLAQELLRAADVWFDAKLHRKLQRLIEIARLGQQAMDELAELRHQEPSEDDIRGLPI
jgi:hypothetical protein